VTITDGDIEGKPALRTAYSTYLEFLEAYLTLDRKLNIPAYYMENLKIQPFTDIDTRRGRSGSMANHRN